jgi:hypothetical protein
MRVLLFLALFAALSADAGEMQFSWTKPTTNCNGTPLTDLAGFQLIWGMGRAEVMDPAATTYTAKGLLPGRWWAGITSVNSQGEVSPILMPVYKDIAPEDFKTREATVYTLVKRTDRMVMLPVGTAPIGTQCIADQTANGHYAVPRATVTWSGSVKPDVVFALCE